MASLFSDFLADSFGTDDLREIEPEEIRVLCEDPVFRAVCQWCSGREPTERQKTEALFDADELGLDPEEDDT